MTWTGATDPFSRDAFFSDLHIDEVDGVLRLSPDQVRKCREDRGGLDMASALGFRQS